MSKGRLIVISGPSGVGKGTICNKIIDDMGAWFSVSTTTRSPRVGEVEGVNYFFTTKDDFKQQIENGNFLEYNIYNDNYYGTSKKSVLQKIDDGVDVILEIDVNGASNIKRMYPDALLIYIAPPSIEELRKRLLVRGTETEQKIEERLEIAREELKRTNIYDYVVINDDVERAIKEIKDILKKEI